MKRIRKYLKNRYLDGRILLHYGTLSPERVALVNSEHHIYADPHDLRARKKIIADTMRQRFPRNMKFWKTALTELRPDTALDIGLNFGECFFSTTLAPNTRAFGFEANPRIQPWVERSLAEHCNSNQMKIFFHLVTDGEIGEEDFFINKQWSGGSTACLDKASFDTEQYEKVTVPKCPVDFSLQENNVTVGSLVFKIDVEGFESRVLRGMKRTLADAEKILGFVEFDGNMVQRSGDDLAAYWEFLTEGFAVYAFDRLNCWSQVDDLSISQMAAFCGKHFHTDLVLTRKETTSLAESVLSQVSSRQNYKNTKRVA